VFHRKKPDEAFAAALYARTAGDSRAPELFEACAIPDTLDGRFDSLALHAALVIDRLRREPDGEQLAQGFFDAMFRHLDLTLREIGVQVLRRNAYGGRPPADAQAVAQLEAHVRQYAARLAATPRNDLIKVV